MTTAEELIQHYGLLPHPEGGYFKRTYCSAGVIPKSALRGQFNGDRHFSSAIYFLLPNGSKSNLHRIKSDEVWHFYFGAPLTLVQIVPDGSVEKILLGHDFKNGCKSQHVVPAGCWFGAYPSENSFSFVGCTVSPGFDFSDFELGERVMLSEQFPQAKELIERLTT